MARVSETGGEDALIQLIKTQYEAAADPGIVELGIGDDAALLNAGEHLDVVTTDLLVENTHFRMDLTEPYLLGWKSVAASLSDIAAMGGRPTCCFVSIGLPDIEVSVVESIYRGIADVSSKFGSVITGGDTVSSACGIVINVTQLGKVERGRAVLRSGARPGQTIMVTNTLGDSLAGLQLLLSRGLEAAREVGSYLVERHLKPEPRIREAAAAVGAGGVTAMMDISDGLSIDLQRLCAASGVGARVKADDLPISEEAVSAAEMLGADPVELAAGGGEDYELLIVCEAGAEGGIARGIEACGSRASVIGETVSGAEVRLVRSDGREAPMPGGWRHF